MAPFTPGTLKGGAQGPDVANVFEQLCGADVDWLMENFDLDFSLPARRGGHSAPPKRTVELCDSLD